VPISLTYSDVVFGVIRREYAPLKHAAKLLARHAKTTPRTAENWLSGTHAPNGEKLINLMAECPSLAVEVNRLVDARRMAMDAAHDRAVGLYARTADAHARRLQYDLDDPGIDPCGDSFGRVSATGGGTDV